MKRNVIKVLVLLVVLLAIFTVAGCEKEQQGEGYTEEKLYRSIYVEEDVLAGEPVLVFKETDKIGLAKYRGAAQYRGDGTMIRLELARYYDNVAVSEEFVYDFDEQERLIKYIRNTADIDIDVCEYAYDDAGNWISDRHTNKNGTVYYQIDIKYDKKGRVVEQIQIWEDVISTREEFSYEYDKKGNLVRIDNIYYYEGKESRRENTTYEYDRKGNLISVDDSSSNDYSYEYDKKGNLILETEYLSSGTKYVTEYFPGTDQKVKQTKYEKDSRTDKIVMTRVTEYSADGYDEIRWEYSKYDGALNSLTKLKYDEDGSLIDRIVLSQGGGYHYSYTYDHSGYLMSKTEYSSRGRRTQAEYYDVYGRVVKLDTYDERLDKVEETQRYIYSEPEYEINDMGGDSISSIKLRTEYCGGYGALIKYTEHDGSVDRTYNSRGVLILVEEYGDYEMVDNTFKQYVTRTEYRTDGTVASRTVFRGDEIVSREIYDDAAGNVIE